MITANTIPWGMGNPADTTKLALAAYNRSRRSGRVSQLLGKVTRRSHTLKKLEIGERRGKSAQHEAGLQAVPISLIRGTEGRSCDFDLDFHPLNEETRDRWLSVYRAEASGAALPAVELIRVGDAYYVRDGHHRVSVARSLGRLFVDARVIVAG